MRSATPAASSLTFPPARPHPEQPGGTRLRTAPSERSEGAQQPHGNRPDLPVRDRFAMPSVRYWKISLSLSKIFLSLSWSFTSDPYPFFPKDSASAEYFALTLLDALLL